MTCGTDDTEPLLNDPRVKELLAEIDRLKKAAEPFIHHSAKLISQSFGKVYMTIEVPVADILNLRKVLKGS